MRICETSRDRYRWYVLATIFIGTFMAPLDAGVVNIALPTLSEVFSVKLATVEWVAMAYLLTTSTLLLTAGRLSDIKGHKRIYITGFAIFTIASVFCGFAQSVGQLVFFRVVQALGGTCMLATGPAILTDAFPAKMRGRALGTIAISVSLGLTLGPVIGGILLQNFGWRWIFFINLPIGLASIAVSTIVLKESKSDGTKAFDFSGSAIAFATMLALLLALSLGNHWGWNSMPTIGLLSTALALGVLFIVVERKVGEPMLDLSLFANRMFAAANLSALINYTALFAVVFLIPFYLKYIFRLNPQQTGMIMTAVPLMSAIVSPVSGTLSDRIGSRSLSSAGLMVIAAGLIGLSFTSPATGVRPVALSLGLVGLGSGLFQSPNTSAVMGSVPSRNRGVAAGMQATMRNVGMVLGIAVAGALVSTLAPGEAADPNYAYAIKTAFIVASTLSFTGAAVSLVRGVGTVEVASDTSR